MNKEEDYFYLPKGIYKNSYLNHWTRRLEDLKKPKLGYKWLNTKYIKKIFEIPLFNPYVNSHRYILLKSFVEAKTFQKSEKRIKLDIRNKIKEGLINNKGIQEIAENILFNYNVRFNMDVIKTIKREL